MCPGIPACQYLRMSTDHQQYSLENQSSVIEAYAIQHGFSITQTYTDAGKSGLELKRRAGLRKLIHDVLAGPPFRAILVYDVSRWGRFLDVDESAHYEFICRSAGVPVHFCAEPFANDGSMPSAMFKSFKRVMAGEYSRELSAKVYEGSKKVAQRGFRTGGVAGYGFRRMLISSTGQVKQQLQFGERKNIQEDRVILIHGPDEEVQVVREIFHMLVDDHKMPSVIASELNRKGIHYNGVKRQRWYAGAVERILKNPKYAGIGVYGRRTQKLGAPRVTQLPAPLWICIPGCWDPIVDVQTFESTQRLFQELTINKSDEDLLDELRGVLAQAGRLTERIVKAALHNRSASTYVYRFGSLSEAFAKAGYVGIRVKGLGACRTRRVMREELMRRVVGIHEPGVSIPFRADYRLRPELRLTTGEHVAVKVCVSFKTRSGDLRWTLGLRRGECEVTTLLARLNVGNDDFLDFHILPALPNPNSWTIRPDDPWLRKGIRFYSLVDFVKAVRTVEDQKGNGTRY